MFRDKETEGKSKNQMDIRLLTLWCSIYDYEKNLLKWGAGLTITKK